MCICIYATVCNCIEHARSACDASCRPRVINTVVDGVTIITQDTNTTYQ